MLVLLLCSPCAAALSGDALLVRHIRSSRCQPPVAMATTEVLSTCRVCRSSFRQSENHERACRYHPGPWMGAENAKHFGTHTGKGGVKPGLTLFWDCCSAPNYDDPGCCFQAHKTYDDP